MKLIRAHGNSAFKSSPGWPEALNARVDRRNFLRAASLGVGVAAAMGPALIKEVEAAEDAVQLP